MKEIFKITFFLVCFYYPFDGKSQELEIKELYDIKYYNESDADSIKHKLNLFIPKVENNPPLLLWIHGGAWSFGDRRAETQLARKFAKKGIAVAVISYRLTAATWQNPMLKEGIQHPEHIKDVARAFNWVYKNAETYKYDKTSIFVSGYSSGGHLSALLSVDDSYLKEVGRSVNDIKATISIAGGYDMEEYYNLLLKFNGKAIADGHVKGVFGDSMEKLVDASPITYLKKKTRPMLVMSETQTFMYVESFEKAVKDFGNTDIEFFHVKDQNHTELLNDLSNAEYSQHRKRIIDYIKSKI